MTEVIDQKTTYENGTDVTSQMQKTLRAIVERKGHDSIFRKLAVTFAGDGKFVGELLVENEQTNVYGFLHGGFIASLIDVCGSLAMSTHSKKGNGVSVDLNVSYINPGPINETIVIEANTIKVGRTLGFAEAVVRAKTSGSILAKGSLTKHVQNSEKYDIAP